MKNIDKLINQKLREELEYTGPERMDPKLEKKLADPNSMFGQNPALKRGALDVQKLYSRSFNDVLNRVRKIAGKETLTPNELKLIVASKVQKNAIAIQQLESRYSDELIELAINETLNEMEVSDDEFIINASLGIPGNDVVGKMRKEKDKIKQELSQEEQEELSNEVFKRDIINAIIGGVARKTHYIYEKPEVKAQLDAIDPKLYQLYSTTIPLVDALYFLNEGMMDMAAKGGGVSAAVDVDDEEDPETGETKTVINATAFMFPILCHEIAKGIEEALARHGYSSDDNMANMTLGQADTLKSETEGLRIGPAILDKIRNILPTELFDKSDIGLIRFFFVELYKIPADEFINLMKYVISDTPSDQDYAKREFDELIEKARVSKEKYLDYLQSQYMDDMDIDDEDAYDGGGFAPNQAPDDYTGGKQTNFDPSDFEDISLDELLKDLNIRRN